MTGGPVKPAAIGARGDRPYRRAHVLAVICFLGRTHGLPFARLFLGALVWEDRR
jgi:hypothetical protein